MVVMGFIREGTTTLSISPGCTPAILMTSLTASAGTPPHSFTLLSLSSLRQASILPSLTMAAVAV